MAYFPDFYRVEVKHQHHNSVRRYRWEIHSADKVLPVQESKTGFSSWEDASQAGHASINAFLRSA